MKEGDPAAALKVIEPRCLRNMAYRAEPEAAAEVCRCSLHSSKTLMALCKLRHV